MKIGIFFGGQSREREISFAGGRTVYDNLNKSLFEPVPVFVDSLGNFILLDWKYIYKGTIRDFFPPSEFYPESEKNFQLYIESLVGLPDNELNKIISNVGKRIFPHEFNSLFDFAFLALHGPFGEDGNIQGLLEWYNIPYSGCGILPSAIGINKLVQKELMQKARFPTPRYEIIEREQWQHKTKEDKQQVFRILQEKYGLPFVVKAPNQGSSIGVSVISMDDFESFEKAINRSLFIEEIHKSDWQNLLPEQKHQFIYDLTDIRVGIGLPVLAKAPFTKGAGGTMLHSPAQLLTFIDTHFHSGYPAIVLENVHGEEYLLIEEFIKGLEFSCIVIQDDTGKPIALPPTQIIKGKEIFDYRAKYLPGITRKVTPIDLPLVFIERIREECTKLFTALNCNVYARIDGFFGDDGKVFLNDPNTTSGMLPSSFFFHQAAEIGLNPSQFLTYIIRTSLSERLKTGKQIHHIKKLIKELDDLLEQHSSMVTTKIKVAVVMGGYSTERHISVESGRNIYEKLASSVKYLPVPVFLTLPQDKELGGLETQKEFELYQLPINIMLKDNADDIREKIFKNEAKHPVIEKIVIETEAIRKKYVAGETLQLRKLSVEELAQEFKEVFIALHGRPGEDGQLQQQLDKFKMPYNGSGVQSSSTTINKYETNEILAKAGFLVAKHRLVGSEQWTASSEQLVSEIEKEFPYPFIVKPHDDGCSSAVKKIKNKEELIAYANMMFRSSPPFLEKEARTLHLKYHEEFPQKNCFLIEELISGKSAQHFLEVTGGMLTKKVSDGQTVYEVFEPSETLASGEVLSLEEKFLAGEGQNITPARYSKDAKVQKIVSGQVRETLKNVAMTLNVEGYCRIDAFVRVFDNNTSETIIIEINSLPGMTPATCIFHQCAINGYKPYDFIDAILEYGKSRNEVMQSV